jgi:DNA-binding transcriptional MerR regulator
VERLWTLVELVAEVATRISALPAPRNGQVRAVPDDRTVRYYAAIGLLDRPSSMRGRTALYGRRHVAQVVAIKRLQTMGRSLSEIQGLWPTLDDRTLARMSGVELGAATPTAARTGFWKREPMADPVELADHAAIADPPASERTAAVELRIELAPHVVLSIAVAGDGVAISPADVRAIRAAAAPLLAELAARRLASHPEGEEP